MLRRQLGSAMVGPRRPQPTVFGWWLAAIVMVLTACGGGSDAVAGSDEEEAAAEVADEPVPQVDLVAYSDEELVPLCLEGADDTPPGPDAPGVLFGGDGFGYCVGPALFVEVESAGVADGADLDPQLGSTVEPIFTEAGIGLFNQLAAQCFQPPGGPTPCPSRQVAIVADDIVVSAPTIQVSEFARDQIVIAGSLTPQEAKALADAMVADGLLEVRPVLLLLGPSGATDG